VPVTKHGVIGHMYWAGFTKTLRVIRRVYNICLLTMASLRAILELGFRRGAAPTDQQPAIKAGWPGETPTACNRCVAVAHRRGDSFVAPWIGPEA
jgi:hypothetical protein